jgi:hypothetical protein
MSVAPDSVPAMNMTEDEVRAQADERGLRLVPVPGTSGFSLTRPPGTSPLTDVPLSLEGIVQWLSQH